jgi:FG-GAP repeat/FG-GAP-like repeat
MKMNKATFYLLTFTILALAIIFSINNYLGTKPKKSVVAGTSQKTGSNATGAMTPEQLKKTDWWSTTQKEIVNREYLIVEAEVDSAGLLPNENTDVDDTDVFNFPGKAAFYAPNHAHNFRTYFFEEGIAVVSKNTDAADWMLLLKTTGLDRVENNNFNPAQKGKMRVDNQRIEYSRGAFDEWFENTDDGLEHGFNIEYRLPGAGELKFEVRVDGLKPSLTQNGQSVSLYRKSGGEKLRYEKLIVSDAEGFQLPARFEVADATIHILIDDNQAVYPIIVDPLLTTPSSIKTGENSGDGFGASVSGVGDINGDGFADVVVGAKSYDSSRGKAYLYLGSNEGFSAPASWTTVGETTNNSFGYSVASAGDINGDGYADVIIGAPGYSSRGKAYVYLGSASGLSASASWSAVGQSGGDNFGSSVAGAGDVNGDGYSDVIVGAQQFGTSVGKTYLYYGSTSGLSTSADWTAVGEGSYNTFGFSVRGVGDINGDGYSDVMVGALRINTYSGKAYLYYGSSTGLSTTADWTAVGETTYSYMGSSVAGAGDVNGDGYADVIVGARGVGGYSGKAFLYFGSDVGLSATADWTANGEATVNYFGSSVASAGDVNGDGYADVVIGAYQYSGGTGRSYVFNGSSSGLSMTADWMIEGETGSNYGITVASAGDIDSDGFADVIVGAPFADANHGQAYLYPGAATGLATTAIWKCEHGFWERNAYAVAGAGDVNGDGYSDVLVGAYGSPYTSGKAYLHLGSATGLSTTPDWSGAGEFEDDQYGTSVAGAGDVNGDGYTDILIGAESYGANQGKIYLYFGSASGPASAPDWTMPGDFDNMHFGHAVAGAGDVNGDGYADIVVGAPSYDGDDRGRVYLYYGSPIGPLTTADWIKSGEWSTDGEYGFSVAGVGDVNGDGYDDVMAGAHRYNISTGRAYLYLGSSSGLSSDASWIKTGEYYYTCYGSSVAGAGDVNGDGYADVIVGANHDWIAGSEIGKAYIYLGSAGGLSTTAVWTLAGEVAGDLLGHAVAGVGDINKDGYADILVGAPKFNTTTGKAFLFLGSASGPSTTASWMASGDAGFYYFGSTLAGAGDINGDGYPDVIIGGNLGSQLYPEGKAYLFYGAGGTARTGTIAEQRRFDDISPLGPGASVNPDFMIRLSERSTIGRTKAKIQYEIKPIDIPFDGTDLIMADSFADATTDISTYSVLVEPAPGNFRWRARMLYNPSSVISGQVAGRWVIPEWPASHLSHVRSNALPVIDLLDGGTINEGDLSDVAVEIEISDADNDPLTVAVDCDNDGIFGEVGEPTASDLDSGLHTLYCDDIDALLINGPATSPITVTISDGQGGENEAYHYISILNILPTLTLSYSGTTTEGVGVVKIMPSGYDPMDALTYDYDCDNDGTPEVYGLSGSYSCPYGPINDGIITINVSALDDEGFTDEQANITVLNEPPTFTSVINEGPVNEGGLVLLRLTATDPNDSLTYDADCNSDGDYDDIGIDVVGDTDGIFNCAVNDNGSHTIGVRANDDESSTADSTVVTVNNVAPILLAVNSNSPVVEGGVATIFVSAYDPFDTLVYDADCNNDGDYADTGDVTNDVDGVMTCDVENDGSYTIVVRAFDGDELSLEDSTVVTVVNAVPVIENVSNNGPVNEGTSAIITITAAADPYDTLSYDADCNGDGDFGDVGVDVLADSDGIITCNVSDNGFLVVNVRVNDDDATDTDSTNVIISNVAPSLASASADGPHNEGTVNALITPSGGSDPFDSITYDYDCNDSGTFEVTGEAGAYTCSLGVVNNGTYSVNVRANDGAATSPVRIATVTVNNIAPSITEVINDGPVNEGGTVSVTITSDPDPFDNLTYDADCNGDGDYEDAGLDVTDDMDGVISCLVANNGLLTINVRARDDQAADSDSTTVTVNNVGPSIISVTNDGPVSEGTSTTVTVTVVDYDALTYDADCNGDGDYDDTNVDVTGNIEGVMNCAVTNDGTLTINVRANDGAISASDSTSLAVNNVIPNITQVSNSGPVDEGSMVTVTITTAPDPFDILTYDADCNGDGDYSDFGIDVLGDSDGVIICDAGDDGVVTVNVRANDDDASETDSTAVTIENVVPAITFVSNNGPVAEGGSAVIYTSGSDPVDTLTYDADCNGDGDYIDLEDITNDTDGIITCPVGDEGSYTVNVRAVDDDTTSLEDNTVVSVINEPPTIGSVTNDSPVDEASAVTINVNASDPADSISYHADCNGDGDYEDTGVDVIGDPDGEMTCAVENDGLKVITVQAEDDDFGLSESFTVIVIDNVAPTLMPGNDGPKNEGNGTVTITPNGTDVYDTLSYDYDCGNNASFEALGEAGAYVCNYGPINDGIYSVAVRANDDDTSTTRVEEITINNIPPIIAPSNSGPVAEGTGKVLIEPNGSDSFDTLVFDYDCDNDGNFETTGEGGSFACSYSSLDDGSFIVAVRGNDDHSSVSDITTVVVENHDPGISPDIGTGPYFEDSVVTCNPQYSDIEQDTPAATTLYDWNVAGVWLGLDTQTIEGTNFDGGDEIYCRVTVTDGDGGSNGPTESNYLTIGIDSDDDGLTDSWEIENFGTIDLCNGADDPDGDGRDNLTEESDGTDPGRYSGPGAPSLNFPTDGAEVNELQPSLSVNNATDPPPDDTLTYIFEIFSDAALSTMAASAYSVAEGVSTTAWTANTTILVENATYFWRARASDGYSTGANSSVYLFMVNTVNDAPTAPSVASLDPADGSEVANNMPELTIGPSFDADDESLVYFFEICAESDCVNPVESSNATTGTAYVVTTTLNEDSWYSWQVYAADDEGLQSEIAGPFEFFVNSANNAPSVPTIASIMDADEIDELNLRVIIEASFDPDGDDVTYDYQIDKVATFDSEGLVEDIDNPSTSLDFSDLDDNSLYFLRVRAVDANDASSGYSAAISFFVNTANDAPSPPVGQNPATGQVVTTLTPMLECTNATDIDGDELTFSFMLYDEPGTATAVYNSSNIAEGNSTTTHLIEVDLDDDTQYWWTCSAQDEHGLAGEETVRQSFIVNRANNLPTEPLIVAPVDQAIIKDTLRPTLAVESCDDPDGDELTYMFEIYSDRALTTYATGATEVEEGSTLLRTASLRSINVVGLGETSWQVDQDLQEDVTYYWRAAAHDGIARGPYTSTASFTIDVEPNGDDDDDNDTVTGDDDDDVFPAPVTPNNQGIAKKNNGGGCNCNHNAENAKGDFIAALLCLIFVTGYRIVRSRYKNYA